MASARKEVCYCKDDVVRCLQTRTPFILASTFSALQIQVDQDNVSLENCADLLGYAIQSSKLETVRIFNVRGTDPNISNQTVHLITDAVANCHTITDFLFGVNTLTSDHKKMCVETLKNGHITTFGLMDLDEKTLDVFNSITLPKNMTLRLRSFEHSDKSSEKLAQFLVKQGVKKLYLDEIPKNKQFILHLAQAICESQTLYLLGFKNCSLDKEDFMILADSFKYNNSVTMVNISDSITAESIPFFTSALKVNCNLRNFKVPKSVQESVYGIVEGLNANIGTFLKIDVQKFCISKKI
jgi:hypothetical protein